MHLGYTLIKLPSAEQARDAGLRLRAKGYAAGFCAEPNFPAPGAAPREPPLDHIIAGLRAGEGGAQKGALCASLARVLAVTNARLLTTGRRFEAASLLAEVLKSAGLAAPAVKAATAALAALRAREPAGYDRLYRVGKETTAPLFCALRDFGEGDKALALAALFAMERSCVAGGSALPCDVLPRLLAAHGEDPAACALTASVIARVAWEHDDKPRLFLEAGGGALLPRLCGLLQRCVERRSEGAAAALCFALTAILRHPCEARGGALVLGLPDLAVNAMRTFFGSSEQAVKGAMHLIGIFGRALRGAEARDAARMVEAAQQRSDWRLGRALERARSALLRPGAL